MTKIHQFYAGLVIACRLFSSRHMLLTPEEKAELLCLGVTMPDDIGDIIAIVKPESGVAGRPPASIG